jgi:uncharacterized protein (TIGR02284 family)
MGRRVPIKRANEASMVTMVGTESRIDTLLEDLIVLDFDAADAYEAAIERISNPEWRRTLESFREDHLRHTRELGEILSGMGKRPPTQGDMKSLLTQGKVVIGGLLGESAVLEAMRSNEADTNTAYERAVAFTSLPEKTREVIRRAREDEHRHCDWVLQRLRQSGRPLRTAPAVDRRT